MENKKTEKDSELPEALRGKRQLALDEAFCFGCHAKLPCFTDCCSDVNIILTPVDVLSLARRLKLDTKEFLDQHALMPITKDLHLPVVLLRMGPEPQKRCSFVGDAGCTVYEDRPWSCRMYPVASAIPPGRVGEDPKPIHMLFEDDFCKGHGEQQEWTVASWRADQGVDEREAIEEGFREIVSHPWFIGGRQLNPKQMELFFNACYDLDNFRRFVFESTFLTRFELEEASVDELRQDDMALLKFAFTWLRFALFGEQTLKVRAEAQAAADAKRG